MNCLIVQPIHPIGLERLKAAGLAPSLATHADMRSVAREIAHVEVVITRSGGRDGLRAGFARHRIARHRGRCHRGRPRNATRHSGSEHAGSNRVSVAEHTVALILGIAKRLIAAHAATCRLGFEFK
jgi:D-3-phosphoglycerate dehydrogenase